MTTCDRDIKQEALIFTENNQSKADDVYPIQLIANVSQQPTTSGIISRQQDNLSESPRLSFLGNSYQIFDTNMSTSGGIDECSILLDDENAGNAKKNDLTTNAKHRKLPCPKCSFQTMEKNVLERHMRKHNPTFVCKICKIHYPSVSSLINHYSKRHLAEAGDAHHYCPMCPFSSIEKLEYDKHITRHETAAYLCQICGQPFAKQVSMKWHVKFKHNINTDTDNEQVEETSEEVERLSINLRAEQMEPISMEELQSELLDREMEAEQEIKPFAKRFSCMFCSKSFSTKLVLRYHAWRSHRERLQIDQTQKTGDLLPELTPGQKTGTKIWNLSKRTKSSNQTSGYQYQCPVCSFSTIYKSTLDRHIKKHGEAKFECDICGMPFTVIGNLNHHKKVHHADLMPATIQLPKRHKCSLCVYNTSYKSTLERHLRTHGIAKYHCELCSMPFVFTGSFVTHRELKHQILAKNFEETIFTDKLTEDSKLSGGGKFLKRRKCPYCSVHMSSASKLNRHLRTHKNAGYYCGSCSVFFHQRSDFENHMRSHLQLKGFQNKQQADTPQSPVSRISQQDPADESNAEYDTSNTLQERLVETEQKLVTGDLATFHNVVGETSNSMVQIYDNEAANKPTSMTKDMLKIDLTEQQLSKASLISRHSLGPAQSESNRHFNEAAESSLKIVSTCGSADQHLLNSSMSGQGSIQNLYNATSGLTEQTYPIASQADNFQLDNSNYFPSQRTDFNIGQQSFVTQVYASNNQNFEIPHKEPFSIRDNPKQQQQQQFLSPPSADQNLHREPTNSGLSHCTQHQQEPLNRDDNDGDLCACKILQPVHGEVLANPPFKGRYAKLVSDFDDFAMRPFACSLCFFRCSILKDLYSHVQNHLTGCNLTPTPTSAKFNTGPYLQGFHPQGDNASQSHPSVPDIEYID